MRLVESCWHQDPSSRPEFSKVITDLENIYNSLKQNPRIAAHAFEQTPEADVINGASEDTRIGAHAFPPIQDDAVDDGLAQNRSVGTPPFPQPQANATAVNDEPQVSSLPSVHDTSKTGSRKRGFRFLKMLNCARISPGNVAD